MIIFEEMMFSENSITFAKVVDNFNSKKEYYNSTLVIYLVPGTYIHNRIDIDYSSHKTAISKLNELKDTINLRQRLFPQPKTTGA